MSRIEIHIIAYNESIMLPFTIAHYKRMFGNPTIFVHDNNSTDDTVEIARREGCAVIPFFTDGLNDVVQSQIKSKAVLTSNADWILCIDADEECMIDSKDLDDLDRQGVNVVQFEGWNVFDEVESPWLVTTPKGVIFTAYSKPCLIRKGVFKKVMFEPGAHQVSLVPKLGQVVKWSKDQYKLLHYKHWSCHYNIMRSAELGARLSEDNKAKGHSVHFSYPKNVHEDYFKEHFDKRELIADRHIDYPEGFSMVDLRPNSGEIVIVKYSIIRHCRMHLKNFIISILSRLRKGR